MVLESNTDAGMTILCNTASNGVIAFADIDDTDIGFVTYDHTNDRMMIGANAANAFMIDSEFGSSVQIPVLVLLELRQENFMLMLVQRMEQQGYISIQMTMT